MTNWSMVIPTVVDTIMLALSPAIPERIPAAHHGMLGGAVIFFGTNEQGRSFIVQSIEGGGWGGRPHEDGESGSVSICQGDVRNGTIEGIEMQNPVLVEERALRPDSGGAGKFRGGLAIDIRIRNFVEGRWNLSKSRRKGCPPWGLQGGKPGSYGGTLLRLPQDNDFKDVGLPRHLVPANCEVIVRTGGGGGWGDPLDREPERVCRDVLDGYISRDAALSEYGVVLGEKSGTYDKDATDKTRRQRRAAA
jgi:N-methylhydantoinase B